MLIFSVCKVCCCFEECPFLSMSILSFLTTTQIGLQDGLACIVDVGFLVRFFRFILQNVMSRLFTFIFYNCWLNENCQISNFVPLNKTDVANLPTCGNVFHFGGTSGEFDDDDWMMYPFQPFELLQNQKIMY